MATRRLTGTRERGAQSRDWLMGRCRGDRERSSAMLTRAGGRASQLGGLTSLDQTQALASSPEAEEPPATTGLEDNIDISSLCPPSAK